MKKLLAIVLTLALVLSFSAVAFATEATTEEEEVKKVPSPVVTPNSDDLPGDTTAEVEPVPADDEEEPEAKIISNADLNEEQKEAVDDAIAEVVAEGYLPVESFFVEAEGAAVVSLQADEVSEDAVIFVVYPDGTIVKLLVKDLEVVDGKVIVPVEGTCVIVIAQEA